MTHGTYVDGVWTASHTRDRVDVINPATEERIGSISAGAAEDVDAAVPAAPSTTGRAAIPRTASGRSPGSRTTWSSARMN
ncbi:aldehyde dehydrogenase family protein [Streptomyces viridosporus]|uniref:aldehyde dehydrogenase family protein n=1 Tax=Streptomyces viridosporus TaxID=67581 RepID=UPI0036F97A42